MTITAVFGGEPVTQATSDVTEAAESSAIQAASVNASLSLQEAADGTDMRVSGAITATLLLQEQPDSTTFAGTMPGHATLSATEAADSTGMAAVITLPNPATLPYGDPRFVVVVPDETFTVEEAV